MITAPTKNGELQVDLLEQALDTAEQCYNITIDMRDVHHFDADKLNRLFFKASFKFRFITTLSKDPIKQSLKPAA